MELETIINLEHNNFKSVQTMAQYQYFIQAYVTNMCSTDNRVLQWYWFSTTFLFVYHAGLIQGISNMLKIKKSVKKICHLITCFTNNKPQQHK